MADPSVLTPGQEIRPRLDEKKAVSLVYQLYGFRVTNIRELNAYDDKNYHIICENQHVNPHVSEIADDGYILKILNSLDSRNIGFVEAQNEMMLYLNKRNVTCPLPVKNLRGSFCALEKLEADSNEEYVVRILVYRPGLLLCDVPTTPELLRDVGCFTARLSVILSNFSHPAYEDRSTLWSLIAVPKLRNFLYAVKNAQDREMIIEIIERFETRVLEFRHRLESRIIHGDMNEQNLLVNPEGTRVVAVIDFGDTQRGCVIFELAIAICYMIIQARDITMAKLVIDGFQSVRKLTSLEKGMLKTCVCARLCQSLVLGAYTHLQDPRNEYLLTTQKPGWATLRKLWPVEDKEVLRMWALEESDDAPERVD